VLGGRPLAPRLWNAPQATSGQALALQISELYGQLRKTSDDAERARLQREIDDLEAKREAIGAARPQPSRARDLGISGLACTPQLAELYHVAGGVLVTEVAPHSVGAESGIHAGDVIVRVAGVIVATPRALDVALRSLSAGGKVELELRRANAPVTVTLPVSPRTSR
jgi:S1-C subfamily serine protease